MNSQQSGGIGCLTILGLIFVTLKLMGYIDWSWYFVLAPFWVPFAVATLIMIIAFAYIER